MPDEWSASELGRAVERIELDCREIKTDLKGQQALYVTRGEHEAWRQGIDREVRDLKAMVTGLGSQIDAGLQSIRAEIRQASPQWWVIAALGVSGLGVLISVIVAITGI